MSLFRYAQFCPLARAAEVVGERWTLLIARELMLGPQRFSDLLRRLPGLSTSVLTDRIARLEERGIVARRELPPPAPASVYELTELGRGIEPVLIALARFGLGFLGPRLPGDHLEPDWVRLGLQSFASRAPRAACSVQLHIREGEQESVVRVTGDAAGTRVSLASPDDAAADAVIRAEALQIMALASGMLPVRDALTAGTIEIEGDVAVAERFPELFEMNPQQGD